MEISEVLKKRCERCSHSSLQRNEITLFCNRLNFTPNEASRKFVEKCNYRYYSADMAVILRQSGCADLEEFAARLTSVDHNAILEIELVEARQREEALAGHKTKVGKVRKVARSGFELFAVITILFIFAVANVATWSYSFGFGAIPTIIGKFNGDICDNSFCLDEAAHQVNYVGFGGQSSKNYCSEHIDSAPEVTGDNLEMLTDLIIFILPVALLIGFVRQTVLSLANIGTQKEPIGSSLFKLSLFAAGVFASLTLAAYL